MLRSRERSSPLGREPLPILGQFVLHQPGAAVPSGIRFIDKSGSLLQAGYRIWPPVLAYWTGVRALGHRTPAAVTRAGLRILPATQHGTRLTVQIRLGTDLGATGPSSRWDPLPCWLSDISKRPYSTTELRSSALRADLGKYIRQSAKDALDAAFLTLSPQACMARDRCVITASWGSTQRAAEFIGRFHREVGRRSEHQVVLLCMRTGRAPLRFGRSRPKNCGIV